MHTIFVNNAVAYFSHNTQVRRYLMILINNMLFVTYVAIFINIVLLRDVFHVGLVIGPKPAVLA